MELSVKERLIAMSLLPTQTNYATLKIVRELETELGFSEDEISGYGIKINEGHATWNIDKENEIGKKDVKIGLAGMETIRKSLVVLDEKEALTKDHASLCEKFM